MASDQALDWLTAFDRDYSELLSPRSSGAKRGLVEGHIDRYQGFRLMFELVLARQNTGHGIVETGTLRNPGNWKDGQSARLFTEFADHHAGWVASVDIDSDACRAARAAIDSDRFTVTCSDSVTWLQQRTDLDRVNLFYLDSWDVKWEDDTASAEHHLQGFLGIEPWLRAGSVVAIDTPLPQRLHLLPDGGFSRVPLQVSHRQAFEVEAGWLSAPTERQRLIRRYDARGAWVSATHLVETKLD